MLAPILTALALAATAHSVPATSEAVLTTGAIAGRLAFRDGPAAASIQTVRRAASVVRLSVDLRSGWGVVTARVDDDGFFVAEVGPGDWAIEYVTVGDKAEFLETPLVVRARAGEIACAGEILLAYRDLPAELGRNSGGAVGVSDRCDQLVPRLRGAAASRSIRTRLAKESPPTAPGRSLWEIVPALRAGAFWAGDDTGVMATAIAGLNAPVATPRALVVAAMYGEASVAGASHRLVGAGIGYDHFGASELLAGPEWYMPGGGEKGGLGGFAQLRFGNAAFGISAGLQWNPAGRSFTLGVDVAPVFLLGGLL